MRVLPSWLFRSLARGAQTEIVIGNPGGEQPLPSDPGGGSVVIPVETPPVTSYLHLIKVKITGNPGNHGKKLKAVVYSANGGKPMVRGGVGQSYTVETQDLGGEISLTFYLSPTLTPGTYLIGVWTDGTVEFYSGDGTSLASVDADSPPTSFSEDSTKDKKLRVEAVTMTRQPANPRPNASASFVKADSAAYTADLAA